MDPRLRVLHRITGIFQMYKIYPFYNATVFHIKARHNFYCFHLIPPCNIRFPASESPIRFVHSGDMPTAGYELPLSRVQWPDYITKKALCEEKSNKIKGASERDFRLSTNKDQHGVLERESAAWQVGRSPGSEMQESSRLRRRIECIRKPLGL